MVAAGSASGSAAAVTVGLSTGAAVDRSNMGATGVMNFSSGSLTTNNWTLVGRKDDTNAGAGATGTVTMTGGTWTKNGDNNFIVGDTGPGTMNMSAGLVVVNAIPSRTAASHGWRIATTSPRTLAFPVPPSSAALVSLWRCKPAPQAP